MSLSVVAEVFYLSLDQSGGPADCPMDISIPEATPLVCLHTVTVTFSPYQVVSSL